MSMKCKEILCDRKHYAHGLCKYHYDKVYFQRNKDRIIKRTNKYHEEHPDMRKNAHLKRSFGISIDEYNNMVRMQGGKCKLCGKKETKTINAKGGRPHSLAVDHCHSTNKIRGLLCIDCNRGIGFLKDSPDLLRKAADYLDAHNCAST